MHAEAAEGNCSLELLYIFMEFVSTMFVCFKCKNDQSLKEVTEAVQLKHNKYFINLE